MLGIVATQTIHIANGQDVHIPVAGQSVQMAAAHAPVAD
jgi:hypothetical protein